MFTRHQRSENSPFITQSSPANVHKPLTIYNSDMKPLSKYSPVMLHLSPATRILSKNPELIFLAFIFLHPRVPTIMKIHIIISYISVSKMNS